MKRDCFSIAYFDLHNRPTKLWIMCNRGDCVNRLNVARQIKTNRRKRTMGRFQKQNMIKTMRGFAETKAKDFYVKDIVRSRNFLETQMTYKQLKKIVESGIYTAKRV